MTEEKKRKASPDSLKSASKSTWPDVQGETSESGSRPPLFPDDSHTDLDIVDPEFPDNSFHDLDAVKPREVEVPWITERAQDQIPWGPDPGADDISWIPTKDENELFDDKVFDWRNSMTILRFPADVSIHEIDRVVLPGETLHDLSQLAVEQLVEEPSKLVESDYEVEPFSEKDGVMTHQITTQYKHLLKKYEYLAKKDMLVGSQLGDRYEVEAVVGLGAMAIVYRGRELDSGVKVAIKSQRSQDDVMRQRFELEIESHAKLSHQNIVKYLDSVSGYDGRRFLIMENVRGISLSELVEMQGRIQQPENIWLILSQICSALEHAHGKGIIHRDLKSGNVILSKNEDGEIIAKLFDFGLARDKKNSTRLTQVGRALGSPLYMSPEQCQGQDVTTASDIYSLGVVAYEIMTGIFPRGGSGRPLIEIMKAHCDRKVRPVPISKHLPDLPGVSYMDAILYKALEIHPFDRFLTVRRFKKALACWIECVRNGRMDEEAFADTIR